MDKNLKIKVKIAKRLYPLSVSQDKEEVIRRSSKKIDEMIEKLEKSYAVRDKQDVLAMCALQYATELESLKNKSLTNNVINDDKINNLINMIEDHMKSY